MDDGINASLSEQIQADTQVKLKMSTNDLCKLLYAGVKKHMGKKRQLDTSDNGLHAKLWKGPTNQEVPEKKNPTKRRLLIGKMDWHIKSDAKFHSNSNLMDLGVVEGLTRKNKNKNRIVDTSLLWVSFYWKKLFQ